MDVDNRKTIKLNAIRISVLLLTTVVLRVVYRYLPGPLPVIFTVALLAGVIWFVILMRRRERSGKLGTGWGGL